MTTKIISAPEYVTKIDAPLIFLAGPIQGAERWQDKAIDIIQNNAPELYIANPRRLLNAKVQKKDFSTGMYDEQVDWETHYLKHAGSNGVILFWLAKEFEHRCDRAYAQTSRFELAEWKERHVNDKVKLSIGIEEGFTGARYIKRRLMQDCPNVNIYSSLEETCNEAIRLARLR